MPVPVTTIPTSPFSGQKPGTSGLRKRVSEMMAPNYLDNFLQCTFGAVGEALKGSVLVVGGDGRFGTKEAAEKIVRMAAANGVSKIVVGQDGILSTPAVSCIIRKRSTTGGIILTASHNPGGPNGDFGVKYNMGNGGPAPSDFTDRIYELTQEIKEYKTCESLPVDLSQLGTFSHSIEGSASEFIVEVIDSLEDYVIMMKEIFDFAAIKEYLKSTRVVFNSLHGVTGPYVERIFGSELSTPESSFMKTTILPDFGGGHPDPNLTYAKDLVDVMAVGGIGFGAAFDGDGDRNMILGENAFFVTPCDSLAVIADNLEHIPYFAKAQINGYARSMPTSGALDRVAESKNKSCYETPTGWKFFGNLLDAGRISLCGEESFGTGSDHIREKDGIWAALAWLQILAVRKMSVEQLLRAHWKKYGRNFFTRYDFENCDGPKCAEMMSELQAFVDDQSNIGRKYEAEGKKTFVVSKIDNFAYTDPVDGSVTTKQGIRIFFEDGSRLVFRLSGTGSSGATVRMYVDAYEAEEENHTKSAADMLARCVDVGLEISRLEHFTGRKEPTVIT